MGNLEAAFGSIWHQLNVISRRNIKSFTKSSPPNIFFLIKHHCFFFFFQTREQYYRNSFAADFQISLSFRVLVFGGRKNKLVMKI